MGKGLKYCKNHSDKLVHCRELCKNCYDKLLKSENPDFKKHQYENHKKWEESHKERIKEYNKTRQLLYAERDRANGRKNWLKKKYNLTVAEYLALERASNNTCYIYGRAPYKGKHLHIDHDHKTGKVRGLLCARCNWYLATIEKDLEILNKIKNYLNL